MWLIQSSIATVGYGDQYVSRVLESASHITHHTSHITHHTSHITHYLGWVLSTRVAASCPLFTKQPSHDSDIIGYAVGGDGDGGGYDGGGDDDASADGC